MKKNKHVVYLGWDGAYVLSRLPLVVKRTRSGPYLAHKGREKYQTADIGTEGAILFGHLKLEMWEVAKLEVTVTSRKVMP